jgi:tRNA (uracil-5-)-methyltransferase
MYGTRYIKTFYLFIVCACVRVCMFTTLKISTTLYYYSLYCLSLQRFSFHQEKKKSIIVNTMTSVNDALIEQKRSRQEEELEESKKKTKNSSDVKDDDDDDDDRLMNIEQAAGKNEDEDETLTTTATATITTTNNDDDDDTNRDDDDLEAVKSGGTAIIRGLPTSWDDKVFKQKLKDLGVKGATSTKKRRGWSHAFVTFNYLKERNECLELLQKDCDAVNSDSRVKRDCKYAKKVTMGEAVARGGGGNATTISNTQQTKKVITEAKDAVCPYADVPYAEQLKKKREKVRTALVSVTSLVQTANAKFSRGLGGGGTNRENNDSLNPKWLKEATNDSKTTKQCCDLVGIVRSPVTEGYRNKSEFTIGNDNAGNPTIGFNVGLFREGSIAVGEPIGCKNISKVALCLQSAAQKYLRDVKGTEEELPVWDKRSGSGFWRLLIVREGGCAPAQKIIDGSNDGISWEKWLRGGNEINEIDEDSLSLEAPVPRENDSEIMVVVQINPGKEFNSNKIEKALERMRDVMENAARSFQPHPFSLTVSLRQHNEKVSNMADDDAYTSALVNVNNNKDNNMDICEQMCGLKFSLSHSAFFQVNTAAAELLYALAGEWASPSGKSLLLDVCCGTGTIGLTLASSVGKVVGLDIVEDAIRDAEENSKLNNRPNCEWIAGKAEDTLDKVLQKYGKFVRRRVNNNNNDAVAEEEKSGGGEEEKEEEGEPGKQLPLEEEFLYDDVVAIVDPPRCGLHKNVLKALRGEPRLRKIVYVSCNPESMAQNCVELCAKKHKQFGAPFTPRKAMAVDLFPHTAHCEAVLVLER